MLHCKKCTKPRDHLTVLYTVFLILSTLITISISFTSFHLTFTCFSVIHIKKHICISHGINVFWSIFLWNSWQISCYLILIVSSSYQGIWFHIHNHCTWSKKDAMCVVLFKQSVYIRLVSIHAIFIHISFHENLLCVSAFNSMVFNPLVWEVNFSQCKVWCWENQMSPEVVGQEHA
jgi:hypothetical protein